ncbi:piggyBac transposable element-derived protein 3-like [Melanaphis sacchari]|uniref:piggyBac transposable element-derived protein 3-like n=1 Tax=Melanaphis sacchari TaxID=742174 RepID=UPI000DC152E9|nr:piggyBac transposable element-derived protein 3-like [Melanaphis sacchari]
MIRSSNLSDEAILELINNGNTSECEIDFDVSGDEDYGIPDPLGVHNDISMDINELLEENDKYFSQFSNSNINIEDLVVELNTESSNMFMSTLGYPRMRMYWQKRTRVPTVSNSISRDRFLVIRKFLKVVNDDDISNEKKRDAFWKVRPFIESVRSGCLRLVRDVELCIDEQMIPFTGNVKMKQFVRGKPNPTGLKNFVLANKNGLVLDFCIYQGKGTTFETNSEYLLTIGESAVVHLSQTVPPGSCLYFDRFFTTQKLLDILKQKKIVCTGTVMKNNIPKNIDILSDKILMKKPRGTSVQYVREDKKLCLVKWFDNKPIHLLSTENGSTPHSKCKRWDNKNKKRIEVPIPQIIKNYNDYMGGVDLCDRMISFYRMKTRTNKWTIRAIFHLIDLAVVNSWIMYKQDQIRKEVPVKKIHQLLDFKIQLSSELLEYDENSIDYQKYSGRHNSLPSKEKRHKG